MSRVDRERRKQKRLDRAQESVDRAEQQLDRSMREAGEQIDRSVREAGEEIERARERVERARESGSIFARPEPGARSPRFSREQIAAQAMEIADAEGIDAVSMRRVATELGAGTMTLYHYVGNKQELLELMDDAMMAELLVDPEALKGGWRDALRAIARASMETWMRHPWLREVVSDAASLGPNGIRHLDQSLQAVADTGLSHEGKLEIIAQVDDYVAGHVQREGTLERPSDEVLGSFSTYVDEQLSAGDYPHLREFLGDDDFATVVRRIMERSKPMDRFERGLDRLLDGVELEVKRAARHA